MKITSFLACEFANSEPTGKVNLIGAGIDQVYAASFPAIVELYLFLHCISEHDDGPGFKKGRIRLMGDDGLQWDRPIQMLVTEDKPASVLIRKVRFRFTAPGPFRLECTLVESQMTATWTIQVRPRSGPPLSPN